jgi:hypothetical protein
MPKVSHPDDLEVLLAELRQIGVDYLKNNIGTASDKDYGIAEALHKITCKPQVDYTNAKLELLEKLSDLFVSDLVHHDPEPPAEELIESVRNALLAYKPFQMVGLDLESYSSLGYVIENLRNIINAYTYEKVDNVEEALEQIIAKEFMHLIIPAQPRASGVIDGEDIYVKTHKINNGKSQTPFDIIGNVNAGVISGLSSIQVLNFFLQEPTFDLVNLRVTDKNSLAIVDTYVNYPKVDMNLHDDLEFEMLYEFNSDFDSPLPEKIAALNETTMRLLLITPDFISSFVHQYIKNAEFQSIMENNFRILLSSFSRTAIQNSDFQQFLLSPESEKVYAKIVKSFEAHQSVKGFKLVTPDIKEQFAFSMQYMREAARELQKPFDIGVWHPDKPKKTSLPPIRGAAKSLSADSNAKPVSTKHDPRFLRAAKKPSITTDSWPSLPGVVKPRRKS